MKAKHSIVEDIRIAPNVREMLKKLSRTADIIMAKLDKCLFETMHLFDILLYRRNENE